MDYYETRRSLIFYLCEMVHQDTWRLNRSLGTFKVVSYLYRTLVDVLSEFVNVRYGNLADASEIQIIQIIGDETHKLFDDKKAIKYINITYLLYNNLNALPWNLSDKICKIIREGKYECQK